LRLDAYDVVVGEEVVDDGGAGGGGVLWGGRGGSFIIIYVAGCFGFSRWVGDVPGVGLGWS
ncbi:hypothetical protein KAT55_08135, partial [Candidatus Bathyarchaeota archaeon]|nr:hypothetical protein [Candidatus Bathyarchaeota archaeon]